MKINIKSTEECTVRFSENVFSELSEMTFSQGALIVTDENVFRLYGAQMKAYLPEIPVHVIAAGEENKSPETLLALLAAMAEHKLNRGSVLIAVGGGIVGDLGGLAASLYMRGIECIQVPTTLLAQVDAAVGGKSAVNFCGVKNLLGTIRQPGAILIDSSFLHTLPEREIRCGLGEIIKHAALNAELFDLVLTNEGRLYDLQFLAEIIPNNLAIKADIVRHDPYDKGLRKCLNLGHTTAHALELVESELSHGECVLWGIICEAALAKQLCVCDAEYLDALQQLCRRILVKHNFGAVSAASACLDKKNKHEGNIVAVVPVRKGECETLELPFERYRELLTEMLS